MTRAAALLRQSRYLCIQLFQFGLHLYRRTCHDRLTVSAGYLAYVTLLSLVPLVAVTFAMLSAFPVFHGVQVSIEDFIFSNFVPASGEVVKEHIRGFVANANKMTAIGVAALVVVALLLISAVDTTLNYIWRCDSRRRWTVAFPIYWMILSLGPILVGASLAISSYLLSLQFVFDSDLGLAMTRLLKLLPFIFSVAAFLMLYLLVPNTRVPFRHAFLGAFLAALLFELSKKGFAFYIGEFPSYEAIYGALAAVPILFVWVYLCWVVVLLGAEFTASLSEVTWHAAAPAEEPFDGSFAEDAKGVEGRQTLRDQINSNNE